MNSYQLLRENGKGRENRKSDSYNQQQPNTYFSYQNI